jgi:hypothetical protein
MSPRKMKLRNFAQRKQKDKSRKDYFTIPKHFESVLSQPFQKWNEIEIVVAEFLPEWSNTQRSSAIQSLVQFLELKVVMEEYRPGHLLAPTEVIDKVWQALVLETRLHRRVTSAIQDFHGRPHRMIHYSLRILNKKAFEEQLQRTQSLFKIYFDDTMPSSLDEIDNELSLTDTSALTEVLGIWNFQAPACSSIEVGGPVPRIIEKKPSATTCIAPSPGCLWFQCVNDTLLWGDEDDGMVIDPNYDGSIATSEKNVTTSFQ